MATIYEVAERAGVSIGTVSRYLNGTGYVGAESARRIAAAVAEMGYVPSAAARRLSGKRTRTLGFVMSDFGDPFTAQLVKAAQEDADRLGYRSLIHGTGDDEESALRGLDALRGYGAEGILLATRQSPALDAEIRRLGASGFPLVLIGMWLEGADADMVTADTRAGGASAMRHLIDLGHRRIGYVGSATHAEGRRRAYEDAMAGLGTPIDPALVQLGSLDREGGIRGAERLLALDPRVSAVFAATDAVALGVYEAAHRAGIRIPDELSVVGFDDIELARHAVPPLTTIRQPIAEMGREVVRMLDARLGAGDRAENWATVFPCELTERSSTARFRV